MAAHQRLDYQDVLDELDTLVGRPARVEVIAGESSERGIALTCRGEVATVDVSAAGSSAVVVEVGGAQVLLSERSPWELRKTAGGGLALHLAAGAELELEPLDP